MAAVLVGDQPAEESTGQSSETLCAHATAASEVQVELKFEFEREFEFEFACEFDFEFELEMKRGKNHKSQPPRTYVENILKYHCCSKLFDSYHVKVGMAKRDS